jgi:hypothetical protein
LFLLLGKPEILQPFTFAMSDGSVRVPQTACQGRTTGRAHPAALPDGRAAGHSERR